MKIATKARINWDELCIAETVLYGLRSTCINYKIGAMFFNPEKKLALTGGYNGPPSGSEHCSEIGCFKKRNGIIASSGSGQCAGTHAEINATCWACAKQLVNLEIKEFVYQISYIDDFERVSGIFEEHKIIMRQIEIRPGIKEMISLLFKQ